jgi:hypothetical protein
MFEEEKDNKIYNLLISKGNDENKEYDRFLDAIFEKTDFLWKESFTNAISSVSEEFFNKIDVIVILSGLYTNNKATIKEIIAAAQSHNVPILLVRPYGSEIIPESIESAATSIVGWNGNCIVNTIKDLVCESEGDFCTL